MCLYTYKGNKFFFAGDGLAEAALSPLNQVGKVDLLQLAHHGEGYGVQDQKLIDELQPKYAYYASTWLDVWIYTQEELMGVSTSLKRVSMYQGLSVTHGPNTNPGNVRFVLDGTSISTGAKTNKAFSMWYERNGGWLWFKENGYLAVSEWLEIFKDWYYFKEDCYAAKGWYQVGEKWFYFDDRCRMLKNQWFKYGESWFYLQANGAMAQNETLTINGKQYTFGENGACTNPDQ